MTHTISIEDYESLSPAERLKYSPVYFYRENGMSEYDAYQEGMTTLEQYVDHYILN